MSDFYTIIYQILNPKLTAELNTIAYEKYSCDGIEEMSLNEQEVDAVLGDRSFCGGDLPDELRSELEEGTKNSQQKIYFHTDNAHERAKAFKSFLDLQQIQSTLEGHSNQDWNEEWKKHYSPIFISRNLEVVPSWQIKDYPVKAKYPVYINPGQGFGTGTHETTYLCLQLFDYYFGGKECSNKNFACLDFGSGSGILGIAAYLLKFKIVDLYDIDENAHLNAKENFKLNTDYTPAQYLPSDKDSVTDLRYDLIFANILLPILIEERDFLFSLLKPDGIIILSGILKTQENELIQSYTKNGLRLLRTIDKGDWSALALKR